MVVPARSRGPRDAPGTGGGRTRTVSSVAASWMSVMTVRAHSVPHPARSSAPARRWWPSAAARMSAIAALAIAGIVTHLALRWSADVSPTARVTPPVRRARRRRRAAGAVPHAQALSSRVRLRPAGWNLHRRRRAARGVPGRRSGGVDAVRRRSARSIRARARVLGAAGAGASHAARRTSPRQPPGPRGAARRRVHRRRIDRVPA